jgi:hypothetical protein
LSTAIGVAAANARTSEATPLDNGAGDLCWNRAPPDSGRARMSSATQLFGEFVATDFGGAEQGGSAVARLPLFTAQWPAGVTRSAQ